AAAQPAAVGQRVLNLSDAPTLLIKHQVADDAADGEFGVFFDWIILQVLIAAITINQVFPLRIAGANAAAEGHSHGRRFDVERFVIFDHADGLHDVGAG